MSSEMRPLDPIDVYFREEPFQGEKGSSSLVSRRDILSRKFPNEDPGLLRQEVVG